ncbi:MAG TPA: hypothetical protein GXX54_08830 [Clostridiales bacterium]|nr:hypothetical protein [Clostridiales bacterium]
MLSKSLIQKACALAGFVAFAVLLLWSATCADCSFSARADSPVKIACVGDSITKGTNASKPAFTYPSQLASMLGEGYSVSNFGDSGKGVLKNCVDNDGNASSYWDSSTFNSSKSSSPDYVIIMLGSNDAKSVNWNVPGNKENFVNDYKELISVYQGLPSQPKVIVATPPTVYKNAFGVSDSVVSGEMNSLIKQLAEETGADLIDINAATKDMYWLFPDGLHPDDTGYRVIAAKIAEYFGVNVEVDIGTAPPKVTRPTGPDEKYTPVDHPDGGFVEADRPDYDDDFLKENGSNQPAIPEDEPDIEDGDGDDDYIDIKYPEDEDAEVLAPPDDVVQSGRGVGFWIAMIAGPILIVILAVASILVIKGPLLPLKKESKS